MSIRLFGAMLVVAAAPFAKAVKPNSNVVKYTQTTQNVQGDEPLHFSYVLGVTSPTTLNNQTTVTVTLNLEVVSAPAGSTVQEAASFVTFSQPTLTFTGSQNQQVTVSVNVPIGASTGDFTYKITTPGWPSGMIDNGTFINMHADPPTSLEPLTVAISSPAEGSSYTYTLGGPPVPVPVQIDAAASQPAPVLTLNATLDGVDLNGVAIPSTPITLVLTDLGTPSANGVATLAISIPGSYTINATATNVLGPAYAVGHFVVGQVVPPPPTIVFTQAPQSSYTVLQGSTLSPSFAIRTTSTAINISSQSVTLNSTPVTLTSDTANGTNRTATGGGTLSIPTSAIGTTSYTLHAHGVDVISQPADADATFTVTVVAPVISVAINPEITTNSPYTLPLSGALTIPFTFTGNITQGSLGATVDTISGTLQGPAGTVPVTISSSTGLGTAAQATGSGNLTIVAPGTYTLTARDTNTRSGASATTSVTFTVQGATPPPPTIVFTSAPLASYTVLKGHAQTVSFAIQTTSSALNINSQSVTLNGQPVTLSSNTANGTSTVATGGATLSLPTTDLGTVSYTLAAHGTDVLGQPADTSTTFSVQVVAPVITVAISPAVTDNSPYTLPATGTLTIPFVLIGDITYGNLGATVDTLTGSLGNALVSITSTSGLGTSSHATASGTLTITSPGTYSLTAVDTNTASAISASTSAIFVVESAAVDATIDGSLFFDVNFNGVRDAGEFGMAGITVKLLDATGHTVATTLSDGAGGYSFKPTAAGTYTVSAMTVDGFSFTTMADHDVTIGTASVTAADTGYGLYFTAIRNMTSAALSQGFWKNNVSKNLSGKTNGVQVSLANVQAYTTVISSLALTPFNGLTMSTANTIFAGKNQLQLQLLAAEYNYASGAYIGGNRDLTYAFIYWGETVLQNTGGQYSAAYQTFAANWMEAYNTSEGGKVSGPLQ